MLVQQKGLKDWGLTMQYLLAACSVSVGWSSFSQVSYHIEDRQMRKIIIADSAKSLIQPGKQYDVDLLDNERDRIVNLLRHNGYYYFNKDLVSFLADSSNNQIKLRLFVGIHNKKNVKLFEKVRQRYPRRNF